MRAVGLIARRGIRSEAFAVEAQPITAAGNAIGIDGAEMAVGFTLH
jgi:hypothetical protein